MLAAVITGCLAIFHNGLSCSNNFSTMLHTMGIRDLDTHAEHVDRGGGDPLPKYIGRARLQIGQGTSCGAELQPELKALSRGAQPNVKMDRTESQLQSTGVSF